MRIMSGSFSPASQEAAREAYDKWGITGRFRPEEQMRLTDFLELLREIEPRIADIPCRVVPASFEPGPELLALPRPFDLRWESYTRTLRSFGSLGVIVRFPTFWQLISPTYTASRAAETAILVSEPQNMPVAREAIKRALMDTIVTDTEDALVFCKFLAASGTALPRAWLIVHRAQAAHWDLPAPLDNSAIQIAQEVHLFPGVPVLVQCEVLASGKGSLFHLVEAYRWELGDAVTISGTDDDPLPFVRLRLPFALHALEICSCGKTVFERTEEISAPL